MYKKREVKDWETEAGWEIKRQRNGSKLPLLGAVAVGIDWYYAADRDIDAGIKVLFDLLQKQGIMNNDRQIRKITHVDIYPTATNSARVVIEIEELGGEYYGTQSNTK